MEQENYMQVRGYYKYIYYILWKIIFAVFDCDWKGIRTKQYLLYLGFLMYGVVFIVYYLHLKSKLVLFFKLNYSGLIILYFHKQHTFL